MSLRVWLPLVRDNLNQGLDDLQPTIDSTQGTIVTGGKLGNCFKTTTTGNIATNYVPNINSGSLSFGGWFKFNKAEIQTALSALSYTSTKTTATGNLIGNDSYGGIGLIWTSNNLYNSDKELTTINVFGALRTNTIGHTTSVVSIAFDTWIHFFLIWDYNNRKYKFYKDGNLVATLTYVDFTDGSVVPFTLNRASIYGGNGPGASIPYLSNDIRIYDHALSPKEVKLLSQGLVCHYKLSDPYIEGTTNTVTTIDCLSSTCYNASRRKYGYGENTDMYKTMGFFEGKYCTKVYMGTSGELANPYPYISGNATVSDGTNAPEYKTVSFDYFGTIGTYIQPYKLGDGSATCTWTNKSASTQTGTYTNNGQIPVVPNKWNHITMVLHGTTAANAAWGYIILGAAHTSDTANYWLFANLQIEEKDHETPYAGVGGTRNELQVYDSSGYNNHLKAVGGPTATTDSIRNSCSTYFTNTQYALANKNSNDGFLPTDAITVNLWIKCTTWGNPISCTEGGGWNFENSNGIQFPVYIRGVGYKVANSGVQPSTLLNDWHMLTGVFNGTDVKIYIDTVLKATTTTGSTNGIGYAANRLCIAAEAGGQTPASTYYVGNISDIRIYATALSQEDIQELYNAPVSIANTGTMLTQGEFVEVAT